MNLIEKLFKRVGIDLFRPFLPVGVGASSGYEIANSLRFRASASAYLSRTPASAESVLTKCCFSGWIKKGLLKDDTASTYGLPVISAGTGGTQYSTINLSDNGGNSNQINFYHDGYQRYYTTAVQRDPSAHFHLFVKMDSTASAGQRIRFWVNNVELATTVVNEISPSDTFEFGNNVLHCIGKNAPWSYFNDAVFSDFHLVCGTSTPSATDFGEQNADGVWVPKPYTGAYGTNGFRLSFSDTSGLTSGANTGLGKDTSGNSNYWNTNGISLTAGVTYDALTDTPTNNYATLNPLDPVSGGTTYASSGANLDITTAATYAARATIWPTAGKVWAEYTMTSSGTANGTVIGVGKADANIASGTGTYTAYRMNGNKEVNGTGSAYGASFTNTDVIGIAWDVGGGTVEFYKQTGGSGSFVSQGQLTGISTAGDVTLLCRTANSGSWNFGQRPFNNSSIPSGYRALCTANLPSVAIKDPSSYAKVVKRTSSGGTYTNSALSFQPDLALIKAYSNTDNYYLQDVVRGFGASKSVSTNQTGAEGGNGGSPGTQSFTPASNGYSLSGGDFNTSGYSYVDLLLKLGGTAVSASGGSGYSSATISANATIGVSVIKLTTNVAAGGSWSVNHGLGGTPDMVIFKRTNSADNWPTYLGAAHASPLDNYWLLNGSGSNSASTGVFNVSSTVVGSSNSFVSSGDTVLIICIRSIPGFSKVGVFTGNGSTEGPFVNTGFSPEFLVGRTTTTASNWIHMDGQRDSYNPWKSSMYMDSSAYEGTATNRLDACSNGFKIRDSNAVLNNSNTVFYWAMARHPFGGSNVSPAPAR